jgi:hypothetical protein
MRPGSPQDDVLLAGCHFMWAWKSHFEQLNDTFAADYDRLMPVAKDAMGRAFNLDPETMAEFSFPLAAVIADLLVSENFEGDPSRYKFTPEQIWAIRNIQKVYLTAPTGETERQMVITKELRKPIAWLNETVDKILSKIWTNDDLRYVIYSSHDDAIANTLLLLDPVDHYFRDIPFASSIYLELHYD